MEREKNFNRNKKEKKNKKRFTAPIPKQSKTKEPIHYYIPYSENTKCGYCEYVMSADSAKAILSERKDSEKKIDPQKFLCDYVNEQYGLMAHCVCVKYV